jgi:hypothetical protein
MPRASMYEEPRTYAEKKAHSASLLAAHSAQRGVNETTPSAITELVVKFADELSPSSGVFQVPVVQGEYGLYGWCVDGVLEKVKQDGGAIVFGWTLWEWPKVMLTAEFHSVWESPAGDLIDITPKPQRETTIVFVPNRSYPADFDFEKRPRNRRHTLRALVDLTPVVAAAIETMKPTQMAYETRRAERAGKTLEEWVSAKQSVDPLPALIDEMIAACARKEEAFDAMPGIGFVKPSREFLAANEQVTSLIKRIDALVKG